MNAILIIQDEMMDRKSHNQHNEEALDKIIESFSYSNDVHDFKPILNSAVETSLSNCFFLAFYDRVKGKGNHHA